MTDEQVEAVARAIYETVPENHRLPWDRLTGLTRGTYHREARAAIAALPPQDDQAKRIEALESRERALCEALEPFAEQANFCISDADDRELYFIDPYDVLDFEKATFTVGDLRRARALAGDAP